MTDVHCCQCRRLCNCIVWVERWDRTYPLCGACWADRDTSVLADWWRRRELGTEAGGGTRRAAADGAGSGETEAVR
ncbi:MAG: hypothetical protein E6Q97_18325 [Desulfurellales bacterium]|nr:MAG: hypothetical protein E6Q97_18325 [Desulfurellales bacterium]